MAGLGVTAEFEGGRYRLVGGGLKRRVQVRTKWASPYWVDVDADGNLVANSAAAPFESGDHRVELWQGKRADSAEATEKLGSVKLTVPGE